MQRATATSASKDATGSAPSSEPPLKRRRTDSGFDTTTPTRNGSQTPTSQHDGEPTSSLRPSREGEETEWVLNLPIPVAHGHEEDTSEDEIWQKKASGRQTFGKFTRVKAQPPKPPKDDADADLSSASEVDASDDDEPPSTARATDRRYGSMFKDKKQDTASPLRKHAERQDRKRQQQGHSGGHVKKKRKTM
jgi:hypothetical protein